MTQIQEIQLPKAQSTKEANSNCQREHPTTQHKSSGSTVKSNSINALLQKQGKTNLQPILTIIEKLQVLHPTKNQQKNLPSRNSLATDNCKQQTKNKIKQLEDKL